jgi:hypothetical protein
VFKFASSTKLRHRRWPASPRHAVLRPRKLLQVEEEEEEEEEEAMKIKPK